LREQTVEVAGDVDRKKLWGRSGSRCAMCNTELTQIDGLDAIVGDEAHIRSRAPSGPRNDPAYPSDQLDTYDNLILLCKAHHKLVDDNADEFPAVLLDHLKAGHEARVARSLSRDESKWVQEPEVTLLVNGTQLANIVMSASAYFVGNDHPRDEREAELVSDFLQEAQDWGDIAGDIGAKGRMDAAVSLDAQMQQLAEHDLLVFGGLGQYRVVPDLVMPAAVVQVTRVDAANDG
jgi:hypothetical protein